MKLIRNIIAIAILALLLSCSYSFTGSSVPSHLQTISIPIVKDKSGSGEANISSNLTQNLIQQFIDDNSLQVINSVNSDAILSVSIISFQERTEVVSGENEKATVRRITITLQGIYKDLVMKKTVFDKKFSNYATFDATSKSIENRQNAIQLAIENVNLDLLLAVVADW
ncbi:MAG: hypothetical protein COW71_03865 [Ignavibacteriales bacterium CG18_big_fil_WC_8_21_14_2_50_31_20]|nr:MAG: hypothetical protein COW71_03865 [Ignavibacteriales bacterium CG18_big_fil_WC_8_21_14_2_50_31_20]